MSQGSYGESFALDRSELFALGAAAGAIVAAGVSQYLEQRRKPKTPLEKAQALGEEALQALSDTARIGRKRIKQQAAVAGDYTEELLDATRKSLRRSSKDARKLWERTSTEATKRGKKARKEASHLSDAALATLGATAIAGAGKLRDYAEHAAERVIGDPHAVSGSVKETLKERADELISAARSGKLTRSTREAGESALESLKGATASATESIKDYAETALERLEEAHLAERTKEYGARASETVKEYATQARESIRDAKLGDKTKEYATLAGATLAAYSADARKAARKGATKLSESATHLAEVTGEQAGELRRGVQKGVRRTRRRTRWGLRAFVVGLVVGLLAAPQSGQRTRDAISQFVENILDVLMPDDQRR